MTMEIERTVIQDSLDISVTDEIIQDNVLYYSFVGSDLTIYLNDKKQKESNVLLFEYKVNEIYEVIVTNGVETLNFTVKVKSIVEEEINIKVFNKTELSFKVIEVIEDLLSKDKVIKHEGFSLSDNSEDLIRIDLVQGTRSGTKDNWGQIVTVAVNIFTKRFYKIDMVINKVVNVIENLGELSDLNILNSNIVNNNYTKTREQGEWLHHLTHVCEIELLK